MGNTEAWFQSKLDNVLFKKSNDNGLSYNRQGERWHEMRTIINPVMMKPTTVKLYVPQVDEITQAFIKM